MKVAAIDIGSNSVHIVIAEITASGAFRVLDREAEAVRLGSGVLETGILSDAALQRGLTILRAYRRLAETHRVEETVAVATSAVREARNGEDFLDLVGRETGIWPRAISGEEEARLIHKAVLHSVDLKDRPTAVVDIGGGSVEIILGRGGTIEFVASLKLGVIRLTEHYLKSDPISAKEERRLVRHVQEVLDPVADRIRRAGFDRVVGTSGTILAIGRMVLSERDGRRPDSLHHITVPAEALREARRTLTDLDLRRRMKVAGVDRRRADILPAGAIVLDALLSRIRAKEMTLCEWALREGILLDFAGRKKRALARAETYPDVRRRSVMELAERWGYEEPHARHVAALAVDLFDLTQRSHRIRKPHRELLEFAALLHDVGMRISHAQHHKHSYYLIKNGDLRGFEPAEIELMANVARYHRGGSPSRKHEGFASLPRPERRRALVLAGLLRLAEALDRSHRQRVRSVSRARSSGAVTLRCETVGDAELERWGASRHVALLQEALGAPVRLSFAAARRTSRRAAL